MEEEYGVYKEPSSMTKEERLIFGGNLVERKSDLLDWRAKINILKDHDRSPLNIYDVVFYGTEKDDRRGHEFPSRRYPRSLQAGRRPGAGNRTSGTLRIALACPSNFSYRYPHNRTDRTDRSPPFVGSVSPIPRCVQF